MNFWRDRKYIDLSRSFFSPLLFLQAENVNSRQWSKIHDRDTGEAKEMEIKVPESTLIDLLNQSHDFVRNYSMMKNVKLPLVLKRLMDQQDIKAKELAKKVGLPYSTVASYLSGKKATYDVSHLSRLAEFFKVDLETLVFDKPSAKLNLNALPRTTVFSNWCRVTIETIAADIIPPKVEDKDEQ
jgi:transcriptional regulator with XRE-family HTH domain